MQNSTQNPVQSNRVRKIILFLIVALFLLFASFAIPIMIHKQTTVEVGNTVPPIPAPQKVYTQEEKAKILEDLAKSVPTNTVSQTERARTLKKLTTKAVTATTTPSAEDRLRILQALAGSAGR